MKKIEILRPVIFPKSILSGVTKKNTRSFGEKGFSIFPGKILTDEEVAFNRTELAKNLNVNIQSLKFQRQVHASNIRIIDRNSSEEESDGMITNEKGLILNITIADCCAVFVYDTKNEAIGAFHSGWRGTYEKIAKKGIELMKQSYSSKPENLLVYLSPCASGNEYEVGEEVAKLFPNSVIPKGNDKYLLDIRNEIRIQLSKIGIPKKNIEVSPVCTIRDTDYHSFRRDKEKSGRMAAFIGMMP